MADLIYIRKNKVRKSEEPPEIRRKPTAQDKPLTELKNVSVSKVFGNCWAIGFLHCLIYHRETGRGGEGVFVSTVVCRRVARRLIRSWCCAVWPS